MKRNMTSMVLGSLAVLLATGASLGLMFGPAYQVVSVNPYSQETARTSSSLIAVNGYWVVFLLLIPVVLAIAGFWATRAIDCRQARGKAVIWASVALPLVFCVALFFSIGLFYVPAAGTLVAGTIVASRRLGTQRGQRVDR